MSGRTMSDLTIIFASPKLLSSFVVAVCSEQESKDWLSQNIWSIKSFIESLLWNKKMLA